MFGGIVAEPSCDGIIECIQLGSVADWAAAVGTVAAIFYTILFTRRQLAQGAKQLDQGQIALERQRRDQAGRIVIELQKTSASGFTDTAGKKGVSVSCQYFVHNNSDLAITDLTFVVTNFRKYSDVLGTHPEVGPAKRASLLPTGPRSTANLTFSADIYDENAFSEFDDSDNLDPVLTFRDAAGDPWKIDRDNIPTSL